MFTHPNHGIVLEQLDSETLPTGRFYWSESKPNVKYPSVTTVLSITDKSGLEQWKKRVGEEEAKKVLVQAGVRGTEVHLIAEDYLNNKEDWKQGKMPNNLFTFNQLKPILDGRVNNIYFQEAPLYSDRIKVAGRVDLIAEFDGKLSIIDFKTSRRVKKHEYIHNYFMQESFYAAAFYERTGTPIRQIVTLIMVDESEPQIFIEEPMKWLPSFVALRKKYAELHNI